LETHIKLLAQRGEDFLNRTILGIDADSLRIAANLWRGKRCRRSYCQTGD
jgi:hypothetical protein